MLLSKKINKRLEKAFYKKLFENIDSNMSKEEIELIANTINVDEEIGDEIKKEFIKLKNSITKTYHSTIKNEHKIRDKFLKNQKSKWGNCFDLYELFYILSLKFAARHNQRLNSSKNILDNKTSYTFVVIKELHGRACQIYIEILCLIENGFADGAYARWRTLYEIMVIVNFIISQGEVAAKAFFAASYNPVQNYDWAKSLECFKTYKYITFSNIEKKCNFKKGWMQEYKTACKVVHASSEGTFGRLANKTTTGTILVGRCDYGINVPATHACITLFVINANFLTIIPNIKTIVELHMLLAVKNAVIDSFTLAEKEIFKEDIPCKITKINPSLG